MRRVSIVVMLLLAGCSLPAEAPAPAAEPPVIERTPSCGASQEDDGIGGTGCTPEID